ncbi:unnamed protein product [marine sediment metagenome]|uniref:Uncharacterized protein n=1 Tax=marine sediment metagenome TaxID=412755 RepID=X1BEK2_9ZZZZ
MVNRAKVYFTDLRAKPGKNLLDNGYAFPIEGQEILDYYVQKNWFFVAMKIQHEEPINSSENYTGAIQPIGIMFFSDEMIYPLKISTLSAPSWGTEVLIYTFSDERVTFPGATEEYNAIITPNQLEEYSILQGLIDETFVLTKLRKNFSAEEMDEDLLLVPVPKYIALGNIINLNSPIGQFILLIGVFIFLLKIKKGIFKF